MKLRPNQFIYVFGDILSVVLAAALTLGLRYDWDIYRHYSPAFFLYGCALSALFTVAAGFLLHTYHSIWIYMGFSELFKQIIIAASQAAVIVTVRLLLVSELVYSDIILYIGTLFFITTAIRAVPRCMRWIMASRSAKRGEARRAIIVGAGAAGAMIIKRLLSNTSDGIYPAAIIDDDGRKQGVCLSGVKVCGTIKDIKSIAAKYRADEIIIAIPSAEPELLDRIYSHCLEAAVPVKVFQSVVDFKSFLGGNRKALSEVPIEELLSRESIRPDMSAVSDYLIGKTVLVTGGAGSIGSELCRQVLRHGCGKLVIVDINENGLFAINEELKDSFESGRYILCLGSIQDERRMNAIFETYMPDVVFHAAAHKHVPMMELNPSEAVKNNIFGTRNVIRACVKYGTRRFLLISTDKAVRPTSIMGATKRAAELLVQYLNGMGGCEMAAVRFGNVLGSNGSVVPTFKKQISAGGPVTVTHKDIRRYFMTIPEAVSLVLCAGVRAKGGEIFVLDMGKQVRIYDLACNMIRLAGFEPFKDINIEITGLRPGEKLYEELSLESESIQATDSEKIFVIRENVPPAADLDMYLERLQRAVVYDSGSKEAYDLVFEMISERRDAQPAKRAIENAVAAV